MDDIRCKDALKTYDDNKTTTQNRHNFLIRSLGLSPGSRHKKIRDIKEVFLPHLEIHGGHIANKKFTIQKRKFLLSKKGNFLF